MKIINDFLKEGGISIGGKNRIYNYAQERIYPYVDDFIGRGYVLQKSKEEERELKRKLRELNRKKKRKKVK